jgi:long-chain acyl-CoA synthetase
MTEHRPWFASYPPNVPKTLEPYPDLSVFGMLEASARKHPDRPALAWIGKHLSYRRMVREVERCSAFLALLGVRKRDRVGLILYNCPQYAIAYYAAARLGAIAVGNNPLYTKREMVHQLRDCDPKVVIVVDLLYSDFAEVLAELGIETVVVTGMNEYMPFPKKQLAPRARFKKLQLAQGKPWPPVPPGAPVQRWSALMRSPGPVPVAAQVDVEKDAAGFIYTGGTTGVSKGAMLSHRNIVANAMQSCAYLDLKDGVESVLCPLPFFHSFGMAAMNVSVARAGKMIPIANPRDLKTMIEQMEHEKPTFFPGVPRLFMSLNDSPLARRIDLSSLKVCVSGGAALPVAVSEKFHEVTGGILLEGYGLTETSPVTHANPLTGVRKPGTIGLPVIDTDCKIVDLENPDREVPPGERGELCIKGPQVMLGYWNRPEETARTIVNGWLHTGDVAIMDEDGYFKIVDRLKEMIIVSGFNVYPNEVEEVLYHHPKIAKAAVIGIPDRKTGEAVKAFVVLREGEQATSSEILAWCADPSNGLTGYRVPKFVEFRTTLPETMIGKVLRRILAQEEREKAEAKVASAPSTS